MPMFDYVCPDCGTEFEELVRKPSEVITCPECGKSGCLRQLAKVAFSVGDKFTPSTGSSSACSGCSSTSCSTCSSSS